MKRFWIILAISISILSYPVYSATSNVPLTTLKIAQDVGRTQSLAKSPVVRVGIGNSNFSSFVYSNIAIYGTSEIFICDNNNLVHKLPANTNLNIKQTSEGFSLTEDDGSIIDILAGPVRITCPNGLLGVKGLKRAGKNALYHGAFEVVKANQNSFNLINIIEVEDYLKGVVPNEMPVDFGLEALKAQSIAARNYVLSPRTKSSVNYDVVDSVASQVYFGANTERELSNQAVSQTEGLVALYNWDLILAQYSSTAGGYTESYSNAFSDPNSKEFPSKGKPYLKAKPDILTQTPLNNDEDALKYYKSRPDAYDIRSPYFRWTRDWTSEELKAELEQTLVKQSSTGFVKPVFSQGDKLDTLKEIKVLRRGDSGKIVEMEIITETQKFKIYKELVIRRLLTKKGSALPSANVAFENIKDADGNLVEIKAYGGGFGHGVGMSQFGAGFMAKELHLSFDKILKHYYTGISIGTKPVIISSDNSQKSATQTFYTNNKYAKIIVDNKFQAVSLITVINGKEYSFALPFNTFGGQRIVEIDISSYINKGKNTVEFRYPTEESKNKALRLYVELVKKDAGNDIW